MTKSLKERVDRLTASELDTLALAAAHLRSGEIAHRLGISPKTVDNRISKAMKTLGVSDRDSAIRLLLEASQTPWGKSLGMFSSLSKEAAPPAGHWLSRLPWPWPTEWRPGNDHPFVVKLAIVVLIAVAMMAAIAAYLVIVIWVDQASRGRH